MITFLFAILRSARAGVGSTHIMYVDCFLNLRINCEYVCLFILGQGTKMESPDWNG